MEERGKKMSNSSLAEKFIKATHFSKGRNGRKIWEAESRVRWLITVNPALSNRNKRRVNNVDEFFKGIGKLVLTMELVATEE